MSGKDTPYDIIQIFPIFKDGQDDLTRGLLISASTCKGRNCLEPNIFGRVQQLVADRSILV